MNVQKKKDMETPRLPDSPTPRLYLTILLLITFNKKKQTRAAVVLRII